MGVMTRFRRRPSVEIVGRAEQPALSLEAWADLMNSFVYSGTTYTLPGSTQEEIGGQFVSTARGAYKQNGVVFACCLVRMLLFAEARMMYRRTRGGRPGDLFSFKDDDLGILRNPWPNGTTGDLLSRMIQHADLAGNAFVARRRDKLAVLRPDWVTIIGGVEGDADATVWHPDAEILGYAFRDGGPGSGKPPIFFDVSEVAHFAPIPDPEARFRGMSWLTPVVREIMADKAMNEHKLTFFEKGATPNLIVKMDVEDLNKFKDIVAEFRQQHEGAENAYKTLFLAAGADATVVGADIKGTDFKSTQGAGETRIAAAAGVPPVIVGLSEGLDAATYSNYAQARRRLSDGTMRPLWRQAAGALATIIRVPSDAELWYDDRDIKFLQEDMQDAANIFSTDAQSFRTLVDGGVEPDSAKAAVAARDIALVVHSGMLSVQLQEPGTTPPSDPSGTTGPPAAPAPSGANNGRELDILATLLRGRDRPTEIHNHIPEQQPANVTVPVTVEAAHPAAVTVEAARAPDVNVNVEPARVDFAEGSLRVDAPITVEPTQVEIHEGAFRSETTVQPAEVRVEAPHVTVEAPEPSQITIEAARAPDVHVTVEPSPVTVEAAPVPEVHLHVPDPPRPRNARAKREKDGSMTVSYDDEETPENV